MKVVVENHNMTISEYSPEQGQVIRSALTYRDKSKAYELKKLSRWYSMNHPKILAIKSQMKGTLYTEQNNILICPSGFIDLIPKNSPIHEIIDNRKETGTSISLPWQNRPFKLRDYQEDAVQLICDNYRGLINFATGLGKTLVAIYAVRRVRKRALIICPGELIARQFYDALCSAFGDHKIGYYGGGKKKIGLVTVGIAASINNDIKKIQKEDLGLVIFDECFPYRQHIMTSEGPMEIGKLVQLWKNNQKIPLIKSFNEKTKTFEFKTMTYGWRKVKKDLIRIKFGKRNVNCTPNHKFLTLNGWQKANKLNIGDLVIANYDNTKTEQHAAKTLNPDQEQILIGSYLGDGHLRKIPSGRFRLHVIHGIKQSAYCVWKAAIFGCNARYVAQNGYSKKPAVKFTSKIIDLDHHMSSNVKENCPDWMIEKLDARGLAIWFMDDGYMNRTKNSADLAVCSFNENSQIKLVNKLRSMGIACRRYFVKCQDHRNPGYWIIKINANGCQQLINLISPYLHPSMLYKIRASEINNQYTWNYDFLPYGTLKITDLQYIENKQTRTPYVFDIEVKDNHNFIPCSKVGEAGPIAHNCHHTPANTFFNIASGLGHVGKMFGLTATDYRSDGKDILITAGCGSVLLRRDIKWGVDNGWLAQPVFIMKNVHTKGHNYRNDKLKNYKAHVLNNDLMKQTIYNDMKTFLDAGKSVVCLVAEVAHGQKLSNALGLPFATGKDKQSQNYIKQLNKGKISGLVATAGKAGEGVDIVNVDVIILASFIASKGAVIQAVGRGLRKYKGKKNCVIVDYIPSGSDMLTRHALQRLEYYKEITNKVKVI
jgi:superfamily II DNA or RNA helicase